MTKPFSEACERNSGPILQVLQQIVTTQDHRLLEVGSGTGQHAVFLAPNFPWMEWHPTDLSENIPGMNLWFDEAKISTIQKPVRLDVSKDDFPKVKFDVVFTANTLHIMSWKTCKSFFKLLGNRLREGSRAAFYGPFKYDGKHTSESNDKFDQWLKARDPESGVRSYEDVLKAMEKHGFQIIEDFEMPANNRTLVFQRLKHVEK